MAGVRVCFGDHAAHATATAILVNGSVRTVAQILAPADRVVNVLMVEASLNSKPVDTGDDPILFDMIRQSTAGTGGTAITGEEMTQYGVTIGTTCKMGGTGGTGGNGWSVEPTSVGARLFPRYVDPRAAPTIWTFAAGVLQLGSSERLGIRAIRGATLTGANLALTIVIEE